MLIPKLALGPFGGEILVDTRHGSPRHVSVYLHRQFAVQAIAIVIARPEFVVSTRASSSGMMSLLHDARVESFRSTSETLRKDADRRCH